MQARRANFVLGFLIVFQFGPVEGNVAAVQKISNRIRRRATRRAKNIQWKRFEESRSVRINP